MEKCCDDSGDLSAIESCMFTIQLSITSFIKLHSFFIACKAQYEVQLSAYALSTRDTNELWHFYLHDVQNRDDKEVQNNKKVNVNFTKITIQLYSDKLFGFLFLGEIAITIFLFFLRFNFLWNF